jgi:regulator of protease activity HflC (stomatin/prohibitin superfamily)
MSENDYLEQVMAKQQRVEVDLRAKRNHAMAARAMAYAEPQAPEVAGPMRSRMALAVGGSGEIAGPNGVDGPAVDVRITGWWRWKTVVVPPNAHVVHTRRGHAQPLHIGLGVSFGYNPAKDSFLVVPGTMQTIMINAYCICRELQGLLVQGYVQWIIADFATAYQKLDFTDTEDPMRVVNVQLREQAEAAIKDKVATMGIDEVLSDKQPIIQELTARLRSVAEGDGEGEADTGLGLRIVTVQIKEAVVSSRRVWENLQKPFRAERARIARLAELEAETVIAARERVTERERETAQLAAEAEIARLRAATEAETYNRDSAETARRVAREQETAREAAQLRHDTALHAADLDTVRLAREAELAAARARHAAEAARLEAEARVAVDELRRAAANRQTEAELGFLATRQRVANDTSQASLQAKLIEALPQIAEKLPKPAELRSISIGNGAGGESHALASLVAQLLALVDGSRGPGAKPPERLS